MSVNGKDNKPEEEEEHSAGDNSDGGLQIVLESPKTLLKTKRRNTTVLDDSDKQIIACVEKDLERNLEQKAAKANLTATHVKNILRHVVTNEDVWALLRHAENPSELPITQYEPKCTRAKAKELLSGQQQNVIIPWQGSPNVSSETQLLVSQELDEDSSEDDEYVPKRLQASTQASKDNDQKIQNKKIKEPNIALRTRSKLSLSHTPLETLEESFIPPDITTDMYDMHCDDDVWQDFLKTFTKPLDEVVKGVEDEDHDPEYNILADEEIDEVDREELRADRAVTVSRKEFNNLMNELFEFADIYENNLNDQTQLQEENSTIQNLESVIVDAEEEDVAIKKSQIPILVQQLRQHVQMLTQNFMLIYEHPELNENAPSIKKCLLSLRDLGEDKEVSIIKTIVNLEPALLLVNGWECFSNSNSSIVKEMKLFTERVIVESIQAKTRGTNYVCTFPPILMETIINSDVFLYPSLLPRIPFRSYNITNTPYYYFCNSENNLLALYLEQLIPLYKSENNDKLIKLNIYRTIQTNVMSHICVKKLALHIRKKKADESEENPIKYYFRTQKAPPTVHYVASLNDILPPIKNDINLLPYQWKEYVLSKHKQEEKPNIVNTVNDSTVVFTTPITIISPTQNYKVTGNFSKPIYLGRKILPKDPLSPLILSGPRRRKRRVHKKLYSSSYNDIVQEALAGEVNESHGNVIFLHDSRNLGDDDKMFPDMPSLGGTPVKNDNASTSKEPEPKEAESSTAEQTLTFKNVISCGHQYYKPQEIAQVKRNFECIADFSEASASTSAQKDNPEDINELMRASSTVKYVPKKEPSGAEKKRAKLRREFVSNLSMASPEHEDVEKQRQESFAGAYFDKLSQTLEPDEWTNLLEVFNRYDYKTCDFLEFYEDVQNILSTKYKELAEEFLLFLTKIQAYKIGKLMPYLRVNNMNLFLKKVQIYFKDQPTQMRKIMKCLTDMSADSGSNMDAVKAQMLPLLKGNSALNDLFLQLFQNERPPSLLANGPSEVMDIAKELSRQTDEDIYETVVVPDCEDPYGGPTCICVCHNDENLQLKTRTTHCRKCGLKFIQGKVFVQSGKSLRPAVVSFLTNPEKDHTKRLSASQRKRSDSSPSKQASPNKEAHTHDEMRNSNESEDDGDKKKRHQKTQRKRKTKHRINGNVVKDPGKTNNKRNKPLAPKSGKVSVKKPRLKKTAAKKETDVKTEPAAGQKRLAEESIEIGYNEPPEFVELKVSSDHSGESESEYLESSQDITNTDSNNSSDSSSCSQKDRTTWTRDEDKIILQTVNNEDKSIEERFKQISGVLQNRTISQIKNRFHKLMSLLHKMASTK